MKLTLLMVLFPVLCFSQGVNSWREITPAGDTLTHWTLTTEMVRNFGRLIKNGELCSVENETMEVVIDGLNKEMNLCSEQVKLKTREAAKLDSINANLKKEIALSDKRYKAMTELKEFFRKQKNTFQATTGVAAAGVLGYLIYNSLRK